MSEEKVHSLTAALASADKHLARVTLAGQTDAAALVTIKEQLMECQDKLQVRTKLALLSYHSHCSRSTPHLHDLHYKPNSHPITPTRSPSPIPTPTPICRRWSAKSRL